MNKIVIVQRLFLLLVGAALFFACAPQEPSSPGKPNIILIVADDLGYSDLGSFGGEIESPVLDKLAEEGLRLPNMHNAGMCVISRSSMLTGKWWPAVGYGIENGENLAQKLQHEGYRTGLIGKWHLKGKPNDKGFDYFFGFLGGYSTYFNGSADYRINDQEFNDFDPGFYSTDAFSDRAVEFVKADTSAQKEPFFLYLSYQSPHNPLQAPKEDIMKYRGSYLSGWQASRDRRIQRQIELGIITKDTPLPAYPQNLPDWETLTDAQKDLEDLRMSVYAAMVERMDRGIGKLMASLRETGQDENTLIVFLSDNGTDSFSVMDAQLLQKGLLPGDIGSNYQPGTGWAYASGTPQRLYKISQHGGGVKTGAIAWWPSTIKKMGEISFAPLHVVDILPTFMDIASLSDQNMAQQKSDKSLAGESFAPLLKGQNWSRQEPMFFQFMDNRAIRTADWSLVEVDGSGWELYNTQEDPLETKDLSSQNKSKLRELNQQWLSWWKAESGESNYEPTSTQNSPHYKPQGDRGTGNNYIPSAMPTKLQSKYPLN